MWICIDFHEFQWFLPEHFFFLLSGEGGGALNPTAGTPPLDLFFFRPDKSPGLPSSHNPILHFLILSSRKMDPLGSNQGLGIFFLPGVYSRVPQQVAGVIKKQGMLLELGSFRKGKFEI